MSRRGDASPFLPSRKPARHNRRRHKVVTSTDSPHVSATRAVGERGGAIACSDPPGCAFDAPNAQRPHEQNPPICRFILMFSLGNRRSCSRSASFWCMKRATPRLPVEEPDERQAPSRRQDAKRVWRATKCNTAQQTPKVQKWRGRRNKNLRHGGHRVVARVDEARSGASRLTCNGPGTSGGSVAASLSRRLTLPAGVLILPRIACRGEWA